jgi:hypothetical protein
MHRFTSSRVEIATGISQQHHISLSLILLMGYPTIHRFMFAQAGPPEFESRAEAVA